MSYDFKSIEKKWQSKPEIEPVKIDKSKPKFYCLDMFPYPSGSGLHVGHWRGYVLSDVYARMKLIEGYNVLHPMGWDAFGLPAENDAIKKGIHPEINTAKNIANFKEQLQDIHAIYDWSKEINTTDPDYYKWTQWIFLQMFKAGLAYESEMPINWCPSCKTGLANEEVVNGECERCGSKVEEKKIRQWVLKITDYAQKLLDGLDKLDWPDKLKKRQQNRHEDKEVEGIFTGRYILDPVSEKELPIWVASFAIKDYGTGIVKCSAHDERDFKFAKKYNIPLKVVLIPEDPEKAKKVINQEECYIDMVNGILLEPTEFKGRRAGDVRADIIKYCEIKDFAKIKTTYKLRDWVFSRQRYWGEPIPLVHCTHCGVVLVPEDQLPVALPKVEKYDPTGTGESPLAAIESWVNVK